MTDKALYPLEHPGGRSRRRSGGFSDILVDGNVIRPLTVQILGGVGLSEGPRDGVTASSSPLLASLPENPTTAPALLSVAAAEDEARPSYASPALSLGSAESIGASFRSLVSEQAQSRVPATDIAAIPLTENATAAPSSVAGFGTALHQAASLASPAVISAPILAGTFGSSTGSGSQTTIVVPTTTISSVDVSHIAADVGAVVVAGAKSIALSSLYTVTANSANPTYLILSVLDRDEYAAGASGATGTLSGNGHTASLSAATADNDAATLGIVFTYDSSSGRYYNSTYGYFDALTYTSSSSAGDITDIAVYGTNSATVASHYAGNAYALTMLDSSGYVSTVTVATEASFTGIVPSQATPSSLEALALSFVGKAWNMNGCWTLASTIAAEAGASLPVASTYVGTAGQASGEWIVAYDGPVSASSNWESALTAGEFVVFETTGGTGHITFVVSGSGSSSKLIDNITYENSNGTILNSANDGSSNDVTIAAAHSAAQEFAGVSAASVVIYELDTPIVSTLVTADTLALNGTQSLSALFAITDPGNKIISEIQIYDTNSGDSLIVNGTTVSAHTAATAAEAASLASISLAAGATGGTDIVEVRAYNGSYWGDWEAVTVTVSGSTTATVPISGTNTSTGTTASIAVTTTPAQTATDGTLYSLTLAANTFVDSAGLSYTTLAYQIAGASAVSWLHYNSSTMTLSGTAPAGLTGSIMVDIVATDTAGHTASDIFSLTFVHGAATSIALVGTSTVSTESLQLG